MARHVELDSESSNSGNESAQHDLFPDEAPPSNSTVPDEAPSSNSTVPDEAAPFPGGSSDSAEEEEEPSRIAARAYQLEMLEASLKQNIIVAMDTGSGKTQVAVLRIQKELEMSPRDKIVWFLVPTVSLCSQQHNVLEAQIPEVRMKLLSGDTVEGWTNKNIWDAVLHNTRVVVSTYQILLDALIHAFVKLGSLSLIVFDEAHNCTKKHAGRRIMIEFYHHAKADGRPVPKILGLTASPVARSSLKSMETLEQSLDAVCKSPTMHREELLTHVKRPSMHSISYQLSPSIGTRSLQRLRDALQGLDIMKDPTIKRLQADKTDVGRLRLKEALEKPTKIQTKMQTFCRRSTEICHELGPWAADYYIHEVVRRFTDRKSLEVDVFDLKWRDEEKRYFVTLLQGVGAGATLQRITPDTTDISAKVSALLHILTSHEGDPIGIVFVKERAAVAVVSRMLSGHPLLGDRYRVASMVGTSSYRAKRDALDLSQGDDMTALHNFRNGRVNLLVATSVLEEGIDVPACNLVICMEAPPNLKSFIQRRGRARMHSSHLYILFDKAAPASRKDWVSLEAAMKKQYEDEERDLQHLQELELSEDAYLPPLRCERTGAQITIDDAKSHLYHFCATLSSRKFVESKPIFLIDEDDETSLLRATVVLPISLPANIRRIESKRAWRAERNACKDAAFQAYKALYKAGLLSDSLLPLVGGPSREVEGRVGLKAVREQHNPWRRVARAWSSSSGSDIQSRQLRLRDEQGLVLCEMDLLLPVTIPDLGRITIYWKQNSTSPWTIELDEDTPMPNASDPRRTSKANNGLEHTTALLATCFGHRWPIPERHQLVRFVSASEALRIQGIASRPFSPDLFVSDDRSAPLVRDPRSHPSIYQTWLPTKPSRDLVRKRPSDIYPSVDDNAPHVVVKRWPKNAGFFHRDSAPQPPSTKPYQAVLPMDSVKVDDMPSAYAQFGSLIPSLTDILERNLVAADLITSTRLSEIGISDFSLITTAISAPSSRGPSNYERLEFLGDSILKICATMAVTSKYLHHPEGYLALFKDRLVANSRLSRAAVDFGLDQYIIARLFTTKDWYKLYDTDLLQPKDESAGQTRELSTKTLADVVEALIGASYMDGGMTKALHCISLFIPDMSWLSLYVTRDILYGAAPSQDVLPSTMVPLEKLIGYSFSRKSLLIEAMTHLSYNAPGTRACYDRLEFLGDAILDHILSDRVFAADPPLDQHDMHTVRAALVNGDFLAFIVMEWSIKMEMADATAEGYITGSEVELALWRFMRFTGSVIGEEARDVAQRHAELRGPINAALRGGSCHPWALLARLRAQKFFSDIFEALLGAVWVDSGSLKACEAVLERAGILSYFRRVMRDNVPVIHPSLELGVLTGSEKVTYVVEGRRAEGGEQEFVCRVAVGERCLVEVGGGIGREEVKTRAAEEGLRVWKAGTVGH